MEQILIALAGLMGALGVILAAAGSHAKTGSGLDSAGYLLLIHACAVIAAAAAMRSGLVLRPIGTAALCGLILGAGLFAADVSARAWLGHRLFPFAAPAGGVIMIVSWLALAVAAIAGSRAV